MTGSSVYVMIGNNPNVSVGVEEDLWDQGGTINYPAAPIAMYLSSTSSADVGIPIFAQGLDGDLNEVVLFGILNGQNQVRIGTTETIFRLFRIANFVFPFPTQGDVYAAALTPTTGGKPDDPTKIHALMKQENQLSMSGTYTAPAGKSVKIDSIYTSAVKGRDLVVKFKNSSAPGTAFISGPSTQIYETNVPIDVRFEAGINGDFKGSIISNDAGANVFATAFINVYDKEALGLQ
jgi:hypothetical protein